MSIDFEISRDFKGVWIPKKIWMDKRLTYFEKCLLAEIHSLDGERGCFASNEYLGNFFDEKERKIQQGISKLKQLGYVYQHSFDGRIRVLKTCMEPDDKLIFSTSDLSNSTPLGSGISHPSSYIVYNKEDNKEDNTPPNPQQQNAATAASVCVSSSKSKEFYGEHGNCKLTLEEYDKLKEKLGKEELDYWIETIDLEAEKQGVNKFSKKYNSHYATILSWKRMRKEQGREVKTGVASHRQGSKLAFETEPDTWRPTFSNKRIKS